MSESVEYLEFDDLSTSPGHCSATNEAVYELVMWVASTNPDLDDITARLALVVHPR